MKPARTTSSVNLRKGPARQYESIDELEKHYPLIVHNKVDGWWRVTAKAQGLRLKDQGGYIDSRFVELLPVIVADEEPRKKPARWLRPSEWLWVIGSVAAAIITIAIILS